MAWYEISAIFFFLGSYAAFLGVLGYSEWKKNKAYVKMLEVQKEFYIWGKHFFIREMEEQDYENVT